MKKPPKWTIIYSTKPTHWGSEWIGTAWEFFDEKIHAMERFDELRTLNLARTMRPFDVNVDLAHMNPVQASVFEHKL